MQLGIFNVQRKPMLNSVYTEYRIYFNGAHIGSTISFPDASQCYDVAMRQGNEAVSPKLRASIRAAWHKANTVA